MDHGGLQVELAPPGDRPGCPRLLHRYLDPALVADDLNPCGPIMVSAAIALER